LKTEKYCFLIGGYDLEMIEIKKLLKAHNQHFYDKNLSWGAKLSAYKGWMVDEFTTYVGLELIEDIKPPENYISIDHHNERSAEPASIEQLALLLNVKLSRYQQLVAANDKGYIPAMKALGASDSEIQQVRREDRKAQGVTEEMERIAEKEVSQLKIMNGIGIIYTSLNKFSPLVDRLNQECLVVYNNETLNYYGKNAAKLNVVFKKLVDEKKAYSGGGDNGFWGIAAGYFTKKEIEEIMRKIVYEIGGAADG